MDYLIAALTRIVAGAEYQISDTQRKNALNHKAIGIYPFTPDEFLSLTAIGNDRAYIEKHAKDLDFYNQKVEEGESIVHPFLDFDPDKGGKVTGHEGRHRAQAVKNAGGDIFWVALYPNYVNKHRDYEESELPSQLIGQKSTYTVPIDHSKVDWVEGNMARTREKRDSA